MSVGLKNSQESPGDFSQSEIPRWRIIRSSAGTHTLLQTFCLAMHPLTPPSFQTYQLDSSACLSYTPTWNLMCGQILGNVAPCTLEETLEGTGGDAQ